MQQKTAIMLRIRQKPLMAFMAALVCLSLGACSAAPELPYPKFSSVKRVTKKLLTSEEKNAAIEQMSLEQKQHRQQAEQELQKR